MIQVSAVLLFVILFDSGPKMKMFLPVNYALCNRKGNSLYLQSNSGSPDWRPCQIGTIPNKSSLHSQAEKGIPLYERNAFHLSVVVLQHNIFQPFFAELVFILAFFSNCNFTYIRLI